MYSVKNSASEDFHIIHKAYSNCNFWRKEFLTDKNVHDFWATSTLSLLGLGYRINIFRPLINFLKILDNDGEF